MSENGNTEAATGDSSERIGAPLLPTQPTTTRSVIFLDFDGVIRVSMPSGWIGPDSSEFCQLRMKVLREVCQKTGARIVVSSDWRNMENRLEIEGHLSPYLSDQLHDDWATPITGHRWNEVAAWLRKHPEVTSYAILEDFAPHFEGCPPEMAERLMLCTNRHGLVPAITERLLYILPQNAELSRGNSAPRPS